jgi:hypothetical protein
MRPAMPATTRLTWAAAGWAAGFVASLAGTIVALMVLPSAGNSGSSGEELLQELSMVGLVALQVPLWLGLLGTPLLARRYGLDWRNHLGWRMRVIDVPVGVAIGLALQLVVVPLLYWPIFQIFGDLDVEGPARDLTALAESPLEVALLVAMTVVLAPLTEEVFFRGLLQGALRDRLGPVWALTIASVAFGITHFQLVQFPALVLVGLVNGFLVLRTGRLGPALWSHAAFNAVTVAVLLW